LFILKFRIIFNIHIVFIRETIHIIYFKDYKALGILTTIKYHASVYKNKTEDLFNNNSNTNETTAEVELGTRYEHISENRASTSKTSSRH